MLTQVSTVQQLVRKIITNTHFDFSRRLCFVVIIDLYYKSWKFSELFLYTFECTSSTRRVRQVHYRNKRIGTKTVCHFLFSSTTGNDGRVDFYCDKQAFRNKVTWASITSESTSGFFVYKLKSACHDFPYQSFSIYSFYSRRSKWVGSNLRHLSRALSSISSWARSISSTAIFCQWSWSVSR